MGIRITSEGLARASSRRPWLTVAIWILVVLGLGFTSSRLLGNALTHEGSFTSQPESMRAKQLADARLFRADHDTEIVIVRSASRTVVQPAFQAAVEQVQSRLSALGPGIVAGTVTYYQTHDDTMVGADRHATIIPVAMAGTMDTANDNISTLLRTAESAAPPGFDVLVAGEATLGKDMTLIAERDAKKGEVIGIVTALIVLVLVFGAVVAALLPLGIGVIAIIGALGLVALLGLAFNFTFTVTNIVSMMGLAVAIDYSLFIVSRYREERAAGRDKEPAIVMAGSTASQAVLFSGMTVVLALLGMLIVPNTVFRSLAAGAILVVVVAVAAALTLLPAMLSLLGDRIERLRVRRRRHAASDAERSMWGRIAVAVMRRPVVSIGVAAGVLLLAAASYFRLETGFSGVSTIPDTTESKTAFTVLASQFSGGMTNPVEIVVDGRIHSSQVGEAIGTLTNLLASDRGLGPSSVEVNIAGNTALISAPVVGDPSGKAAVATVQRIRSVYVANAFPPGLVRQVLVGGDPALNKDFFDTTARYQPIVLAFVLALSFLLLMMVFRSVVVPLTSIVLNLLSVGAAYGLLVLVFQQGGPGIGKWLAGLFGFQQVQVIEAWLPLFLFSILFGLSMDYHVFLLSRIRERYLQTGDNTGAVAYGLSRTGGIITGAALIMVAVFAGFASGELVMFQQMGFGLAVAVLLDATIVRSVLVPATMKLLGNRNWYLPSWLRWLPSVSVEPHAPRLTLVEPEPKPRIPERV